MKLSESIALHTPVLKAGGVGSGPQLPAIQREIAQRMANHLKVVSVHTPSQSRFSPTPKLATPGKVGHSGPGPKAPSGGPKMTRSAPRPGGKIGAGGPGSGRHPASGLTDKQLVGRIVKRAQTKETEAGHVKTPGELKHARSLEKQGYLAHYGTDGKGNHTFGLTEDGDFKFYPDRV